MSKPTSTQQRIWLIAGGMLIGGIAIGLLAARFTGGQAPTPQVEKKTGPCPGGAQPLAWRNPMNPNITSPTFTKDEMGMDYLPICAEQGKHKAPVGTVTIDPTVVQDIGVRTAIAKKEAIARDIRTVGRVTPDEERVAHLHPKVDGWVEKMFIDKTGEKVHKNTMLLAIYSPQLVASAEEYVLALKNWRTLKDSSFPDVRNGARQLLQTSLDRLKLLDVPAHQLRDIRKTGHVPKALHIHSPFDGIVMKIGVREGSRITPATELYTIADLSRIWVSVDIYENDIPWVRQGDMAEMRLPAVPGRVFTGKVSYVYPYLESKTRTNKVRLEFANPDLLLKPDMFANVTIQASRRVNAIVVPSEAVIRTGTRNVVFVQRAPGKFEPRDVKLGIEAHGEVQIVSGIQAGERVVTSGQFLIDSESSLKEATAKMLEPKKKQRPAADMNMSGMQMEKQKAPQQTPQDMDMGNMQMPGSGQ